MRASTSLPVAAACCQGPRTALIFSGTLHVSPRAGSSTRLVPPPASFGVSCRGRTAAPRTPRSASRGTRACQRRGAAARGRGAGSAGRDV